MSKRVEQQDEALEFAADKLQEVLDEAKAVGHLTLRERAYKLLAYVESERNRLREEGLLDA